MNVPFVHSAVLHTPAHKANDPLSAVLRHFPTIDLKVRMILLERVKRFEAIYAKPVITWDRRTGYAPVGYVCPQTGRVAVNVKQFANSDLNGDASAYWFEAIDEEFGLDPWRVVEGVDPYVHDHSAFDCNPMFDVWFEGASGSRHVGDRDTFFVSAKDAALLAREFA